MRVWQSTHITARDSQLVQLQHNPAYQKLSRLQGPVLCATPNASVLGNRIASNEMRFNSDKQSGSHSHVQVEHRGGGSRMHVMMCTGGWHAVLRTHNPHCLPDTQLGPSIRALQKGTLQSMLVGCSNGVAATGHSNRVPLTVCVAINPPTHPPTAPQRHTAHTRAWNTM